MARIVVALLGLALLAPAAQAQPADERRIYRKTNGGGAKGTLFLGQLFQPRAVRAVLVANPRTTYTAAAQMTCRMADGRLRRTSFQRTVRKARYEIRVPMPKGKLPPTGGCTVEAGGFKRPALGRTRLTLTVFATLGAPVVRLATPALRGSAYVGGFLSIDETAIRTYGNRPLKTAYAWQRCDASGAGCADIPGETASEYRPAQADLGMRLRARVSATSPDGTGAAHTAPSAVVVQDDPEG